MQTDAIAAQAAGRSLRTGELAAMCGLSRDTITNYARAGRIPATRTPTGHWRFWLADVEPLLPSLRRVAR